MANDPIRFQQTLHAHIETADSLIVMLMTKEPADDILIVMRTLADQMALARKQQEDVAKIASEEDKLAISRLILIFDERAGRIWEYIYRFKPEENPVWDGQMPARLN